MADQLNVDVDALEVFAGQLDTTRTQFDATAKDISDAAAALGNPRLATALEDFDHRWQAHREVLDSYFSALSHMVSDSARTLRQKDFELAQIHEAASLHRHLGPS